MLAGGVRRRQRGANLVERSVQVVAQALHGGDRGDRDQSSDEAVFDGGGALLVAEQLAEELHGFFPSLDCLPGLTRSTEQAPLG